LAPHLTEANCESVLREASHKSKREIEQIVARLLPRPDAPSMVRRLPQKAAAAENTAPTCAIDSAADRLDAKRAVALTPVPRLKTKPLAPGRFKVQFTVGEETYGKLRRVQDLLRHRLPSGDLAAIFDRALTLLLTDLEKSKLAATKRPRTSSSSAKSSRHVPFHVRRMVWARAGGVVDLKDPQVDALRRGGSSSTMSFRTRMVARPQSRISSFAAQRTIGTRRNNAGCLCGRSKKGTTERASHPGSDNSLTVAGTKRDLR